MLASLAAAHLEAMPALAKWMGARCLLDSEHGLDSLATAIAWAPALSLSSPAWHSLHASLHQLLQEPEVRVLRRMVRCILADAQTITGVEWAYHYACHASLEPSLSHCLCS